MPEARGDSYQREVERLTRYPGQIGRSWLRGEPLFRFVAPVEATVTPDGEPLGCLTMVRSGRYAAWSPALTRRIRSDVRLPATVDEITPAHLPHMAAWMRELGRIYGWPR